MGAWRKNISTVMAIMAATAGCATSSPVDPFASSGRVWPDAPAAPRIAYVGQFRSPGDLGIEKSFWQRLVSLTAGRQADELARPMAVISDLNAEVIYVADPDANCVHRYDRPRRRYDCLGTSEDEGPVAPVGLALTADGWLYASDSRSGRLLRLKPEGERLEPFYAGAILEQPTGLFWDESTERLFVVDTAKQQVLAFDRSGNLKTTFGARGSAAGEFNFPTYVWGVDDGNLLVTDSLNFRIQTLTHSGKPVAVFGQNGDQPGGLARPKGLAMDSVGHIYVVDALMHLVQVFDRNGVLLIHFGEQGQGEGQFWLPNGIFVTRNNLIFVADSYNKRIQVFRYVGPT